jgi:hypothetical protein
VDSRSAIRSGTSFAGIQKSEAYETRSHLKKVFSDNIGVNPSSQVLDIRGDASGLILGLALISIENPNVEIASIWIKILC